MKNDARIAIIGGGISGLSVAYKLAMSDQFHGSIKIFERSPTLGGNADTAKVILGRDFRNDQDKGEPFVRLADMGVNDINLNSYPKTREAMEEIGYFHEIEKHEHLRTLEDTVCFFSPDNRDIWTKDTFLKKDQPSVIDTRFSLQAEEHSALCTAEEEFMEKAADDYDESMSSKPHWNYTVDEYVDSFTCTKEITPDLLKQLVRLFLKPRIAAMYFANDAGPGGMPMRGVMSYYRLQEGYGQASEVEPDRRYFVKGSQDWINELANFLENDSKVKNNIEIEREYYAKVEGNGEGGVFVYRREPGVLQLSEKEVFDAVVMAAHADHQLASFVPGSDPLIDANMVEILSDIEYSDSISIAHTFAGVLPANADSWRTYNVMIRDDHVQTPYQMTYVQNRHRNDRKHPDFNEHGMPTYFVSLNPEIPIPDRFVLRMTEEESERRENAMPGYMPDAFREAVKEGKAVSYFRHTVMTKRLLEIQDHLEGLQGGLGNRVFFAGCWAYGAGLHEECFIQAENVVKAMYGKPA